MRKALDRVAALVSPMLKAAPGFEKHLSGPVRHALGYCDGLVASLPGPTDINRKAFASDPLVHALFATADDIDQMLGHSEAVRDFLEQPSSWDSPYFYAMLAARRQQKKQLGIAQQGDVIRNDVPQLVLYFSNQTLIEPSCELDATRLGLRCKALESLLLTFQSHVQALQQERDDLRSDLSTARAQLAGLRTEAGDREREIGTRRLAELDAKLRQTAASLMPEHLIATLADYLNSPEPALHLTPVSITVDRLGIVSDDVGQEIHTLSFPELTARDRRLHLVTLVRISRDEALEAVNMVRDQQRRFMLI